MDRRTILAITICFLIFAAWNEFYIKPHMPQPQQQQSSSAGTVAQNTGTSTSPVSIEPVKAAVAKGPSTPESAAPMSKTLQLSNGSVEVTNGEKMFTSWNLKSYRKGILETDHAIDAKMVTHQDAVGSVAFDSPEYSYLNAVRGKMTETPDGVTWTYEDQKIKLTRTVKASDKLPYLQLLISAEFKDKKPTYAFVSMQAGAKAEDLDLPDRQLNYWNNKAIHRVTLDKNVELTEVPAPVTWVAATNRYFVMSMLPEPPTDTSAKAVLQPMGEKTGQISLVYPITTNSIQIPVKVFFGPKEINLLQSIHPTLEQTVDFGWFTLFAYPLIKIMKWFYDLCHNYGVAIILLTLLVKILTFPLTYKSMKSMKQVSKLQPQLQKLRDKYKDDKEALNRETLNFMRSHGYNPMAGCLPILIQMPVFFALYRVLYSSIELYHAPFYFWIKDLSEKDPYYITPVLLTAIMYIQQKMTPATTTDPAQAKMLQFMPVIFGVFMLTLPSGLTIYMLVNALAGIVQQIFLNKKLDMGGVGTPAVEARAR
ncbi:membrane protein insertase YidC [bacterium]|jgi:YidC/Oxa1 family membrane protein insertase|nr:membrane protein insertase YidC [bacterium]